ncbi:S41 family peptidase [Paenibacillus sacheonensis]|uniref:PDZ domain-containing protein n=1 Tax=Paenibacillus sacheonensis TaxID=742054 RepID=A0A7X5BYG1_9BACL|nr:S41 family peptidase [Paenibacillus sacheonensis]MBM7566916.1 carboxyl-terminal processing protease [Paenibacillus sacheonensis]NBC71538.1 PDZ domain-containing protein [Paenibacillus sacheonensis]
MNRFGEKAAKQRQITLIVLVVVLVAAGFAGGRLSMQLQYPIMKDKAFGNLSYAYNEIMADYLNGAASKALVDGAAEGMVGSLQDPYSVYLSEDKGEAYMQSYQDHFVGIGVEIRQEDGSFIIDSIIKGAPAEKAKLMKEDRIASIDGKSVKGLTFDELKTKLQGKSGSKVSLQIERQGGSGLLTIPVVRGDVPVLTVSSAMKSGGIGEITISRFAEKTSQEFTAAIEKLQKQGMKALLLDLRGNPGGLLNPTIEIANRFVPKGKTIVQVVYKDEKRVLTHKSSQKEPWKLPIAILVDAHTASSAEVLTAALKDTAGAQVVGEKTFGKGIVQNFNQLKDGSVLKLTEAQWRTPDGQWIHKKGIEPNVAVAAPDYALLPRLNVGLKLTNGDYGDQVVTVQKMLQTIGYDTGEGSGIYDEPTAAAVRAFQQKESLPVTGDMNDRTANRIMAKLMVKYQAEDPQLGKAMELLQAAKSGAAAGS